MDTFKKKTRHLIKITKAQSDYGDGSRDGEKWLYNGGAVGTMFYNRTELYNKTDELKYEGKSGNYIRGFKDRVIVLVYLPDLVCQRCIRC